MYLTDTNTDALAELLNIGHGRAAAALSEMTGCRIALEAPSIAVMSVGEVGAFLEVSAAENLACVNQAFTGSVAGNAMLLFDEASATMLSNLLDEKTSHDHFDIAAKEMVTEAGNVLLNACLGAFGNLLEVQFAFAVPTLTVDSVPALLKSIMCDGRRLSHAIVGQTRFSLGDDRVSGTLVIILGVTSFECLVEALERWERG